MAPLTPFSMLMHIFWSQNITLVLHFNIENGGGVKYHIMPPVTPAKEGSRFLSNGTIIKSVDNQFCRAVSELLIFSTFRLCYENQFDCVLMTLIRC